MGVIIVVLRNFSVIIGIILYILSLLVLGLHAFFLPDGGDPFAYFVIIPILGVLGTIFIWLSSFLTKKISSQNIIKSIFEQLVATVGTLLLIGIFVFAAMNISDDIKCDRASAEKFAIKRMKTGEIISGPRLISENDNCTFTFTARIKNEPRWDPMQQRNRVAILDMEITVSMKKGEWEVLDVESSYVRDY